MTKSVYVAIHVRRGYTTATKEYLSVVEDWKQLKCSLLDTRYINFLPLASREIHMATLAFCNHTIITTTTFSWWIGYLAGGEVLYYKDWPKRNSVLDREVVKEDYFLSSWIGLS
ncbi:unnamed protein product [Enterobius vermicularis]|uniref:L-Fucosyltransferase n=1 Tax=Enterobius vermicularis TaxID=51028 RepID=A0A3P6IYL2_ENTVE|nr:unnamed protein product [Enterobius vermicularis]